MAHVTRNEWYRRVNATWPEGKLPPLTPDEAWRAARRLFRFETGDSRVDYLKVTSGNRRTLVRGRTLVFNPVDGWHTLVHIVSHYACPGHHGAEHARCEIAMIKEVLKRGWLNGTLTSEPKPEPVRDAVAERAKRIDARLVRWERRLKRAQTAIRKLKRQQRYYAQKTGAAK
jgi:hypothetical protein